MVVPNKNGKLHICVDFQKLNATTKEDSYLLTFMKEVLDMVVGHEVYSFWDGFSSSHQIMIAPKDQYKTTFITKWGIFVWLIMPFGLKNVPPTSHWAINMVFKEYLGVFMKLFLDYFNIFSDLKTHLAKLDRVSTNVKNSVWT